MIQPVEQKAKIVYDYKAEDDSQLTIKTGDIVTLIGDVTPEGWILAKNSFSFLKIFSFFNKKWLI